MEKENNSCCAEKSCENCSKDNMEKGCCCHWKKCRIMKKVLWIFVIILAFTLGSQVGEMKSYKYRDGGCGMRSWGYKGDYIQRSTDSSAEGQITIPVTQTPQAPAAKQ